MLNRIFIIILLVYFAQIPLSAKPEKPLSIDAIIQKMDLATDPENNKLKIKTLVTVIDFAIPSQGMQMTITTTDKFPDKSKTVKEVPGVLLVTRIFNGHQAWEMSNLTEIREIKDKELLMLKFEMFMKNPAVTMQQAFKKIKIADRNALLGENMCYKLVCTPAVEVEMPDFIMYINKDTFLTEQIEMIAETPQGPIKFTTIMEEYKKINGRMIPVKIKMIQGGLVMQKTLISVKENIEIDDREFENPTVEVFK